VTHVGADGKLGAEQVADVPAPLFVAWIQAPAMPKTYRLIADACLHSPVRPTQEDLRRLMKANGSFGRTSD